MPLTTLDLTQLDMHEAAVPLPSLPPRLDVQLSDSPQVVFVEMGVNDAPYAVVVGAAERQRHETSSAESRDGRRTGRRAKAPHR